MTLGIKPVDGVIGVGHRVTSFGRTAVARRLDYIRLSWDRRFRGAHVRSDRRRLASLATDQNLAVDLFRQQFGNDIGDPTAMRLQRTVGSAQRKRAVFKVADLRMEGRAGTSMLSDELGGFFRAYLQAFRGLPRIKVVSARRAELYCSEWQVRIEVEVFRCIDVPRQRRP